MIVDAVGAVIPIGYLQFDARTTDPTDQAALALLGTTRRFRKNFGRKKDIRPMRNALTAAYTDLRSFARPDRRRLD